MGCRDSSKTAIEIAKVGQPASIKSDPAVSLPLLPENLQGFEDLKLPARPPSFGRGILMSISAALPIELRRKFPSRYIRLQASGYLSLHHGSRKRRGH